MRINLHDVRALLNVLFKLMAENEIPVCQIFAVMRQMDVLLDIVWDEIADKDEFDGEDFKEHLEKQLKQIEDDENKKAKIDE